jgi:polyhydroxybutyrate depolymerase
MAVIRVFGCAVAAFAFGCTSSNTATMADASSPADAATSVDAEAPISDAAIPWAPGPTNDASAAIVAARPYTLNVPSSYDAAQATPLVVMFHGYGSTGQVEESYLDITATSNAEGFLYAYGEGLIDDSGSPFWNATDACCNFYGSKVDDVAYFNAIVDDISAKYNVDPKRVFVLGHSNGAFMAHRLACDVAPRVAAIVSLAGAVWNDPSKCNPANHVAILDVHGNADQTIGYDGGSTQSGVYPSEQTTMATWAQKNGCTGELTATTQTLDIDPLSATTGATYGGCPNGIDVQLWTIQGGPHIPALTKPTWGDSVWGFMSSHPKP